MLVALAALFGAALTIAACYGAGALLIARLGAPLKPGEKFPLALVLGAAMVHLAVFAALALKIGYKPVWLIGLGAVIVASRRHWGWRWRMPRGVVEWCGALVFAAFTLLYFVNAWAPEASADGSGYHLELVARYLRIHGFERITTNMYASLGAGVEMLYVPAFAFGKHSAAALVHFSFTVALALAMFAYGRRIGKPWAGAAGALLTYLSPAVGRDGTTAYIDVAVAAIVFSVFYWLEVWDESRSPALLIPIGLLAGYSYAAKYTAFVMLPYALLWVAWRTRKVKPLLLVSACAAVMMGPWMIRNWIYMENPVAPFFNQVFRNPNVHIFSEQSYSAWLRNYDLTSKWALPYEATVRGSHVQGIVGAVFLCAPLGLLALRNRAGRRLLAAGAVLLVAYFANIGARFLIPCLPFFSLAMAIALENARWLAALLILFEAVTGWPPGPPPGADPSVWRIIHFPVAAALRRTPEDEYLRANLPSYSLARMVEANTPRGARVFSLNGIPQAYMSHDFLVGFQSASNELLAESLYMATMEVFQPTRMLRFQFPEHSAKRLRLLQTAKPVDPLSWNVHELRFFYRDQELPRRPEWRLRAWPNPWEVQLAFDNSPATRWRAWETARPGMYLDVDFGREELVDEVRMETSEDYQWPIALRVEAWADGKWSTLADGYKEWPNPIKVSMRRAAIHELAVRGLNYLLIQDGDPGARDYRADPAEWGLRVVASEPGATLYRVVE